MKEIKLEQVRAVYGSFELNEILARTCSKASKMKLSDIDVIRLLTNWLMGNLATVLRCSESVPVGQPLISRMNDPPLARERRLLEHSAKFTFFPSSRRFSRESLESTRSQSSSLTFLWQLPTSSPHSGGPDRNRFSIHKDKEGLVEGDVAFPLGQECHLRRSGVRNAGARSDVVSRWGPAQVVGEVHHGR
jgi:hypothetical protein